MLYFLFILVFLVFLMSIINGIIDFEGDEAQNVIYDNFGTNLGAFYMLIYGENPYGDNEMNNL